MVVYTQQGPLKVSSRSCRVIEDYSVASVMVVLYRHRAPKLSQQLVSLVQYKRATHLLQRGDVFVFSDGTPWHSWQLLGLFLGHKRWQTHAPRAPHAPGAPHAPRAPQAPRTPHDDHGRGLTQRRRALTSWPPRPTVTTHPLSTLQDAPTGEQHIVRIVQCGEALCCSAPTEGCDGRPPLHEVPFGPSKFFSKPS